MGLWAVKILRFFDRDEAMSSAFATPLSNFYSRLIYSGLIYSRLMGGNLFWVNLDSKL